MSFDLNAWGRARRDALDAFLAPLFLDAWPPRFSEALRYPVFAGGKRVRPLLAYAAAEALGAVPEHVHHAAGAVELVHTYSLVHDDLPAMDDDDERRGRPTVHVAFDEATAILVGDGLLTEAFGLLAVAPHTPAAVVAMVRELAVAAGAAGMVGGQAADIALGASIADVETLQRVHAGKTGALIRAATLLGGLSAGADDAQLAALSAYGEAVGLAFQLADDVLDAEEDEGAEGPPSYVRLLGVDETLRRARALADEAAAAVASLPDPTALVALARFTVERDV